MTVNGLDHDLQQRRVLYQNGAGELTGEYAALVVPLRAAGAFIAVTHVHGGQQRRFHAGNDGATVDKAHHSVLIEIRVAVNVLHEPLFVLNGSEAGQPQTLVYFSGVVGDRLAQQLHGVPGEQHGHACVRRRFYSIPQLGEIQESRLLRPLCPRAHVDKVRMGQIGVSAKLHPLHRDGIAHGLQRPLQNGHVGIASVKAHEIRIEVQNSDFHGLALLFHVRQVQQLVPVGEAGDHIQILAALRLDGCRRVGNSGNDLPVLYAGEGEPLRQIVAV